MIDIWDLNSRAAIAYLLLVIAFLLVWKVYESGRVVDKKKKK